MIKREDILHKTTYVWKENEKYTSIIKNDGSRVILNKKDSDIWKIINDDDTVDDIIRHMKDTSILNYLTCKHSSINNIMGGGRTYL